MTSDMARKAYADLVPSVRAWRLEGQSLRQIAKLLNDRGYTCRGGGPMSVLVCQNGHNHVQIKRILERYC